MKKVACILISVVTMFIGIHPSRAGANVLRMADTTAYPYEVLSVANAEKILGEKVKLTERISTNKNSVIQYKCTYLAGSELVQGGKPCNLYYSVEKYPSIAVAQKVHADIVSSNAGMPGQKILSNIGDEAWFHTDGSNFAMIVVRKGNMMLRIKVNKLTPKTSVDELQKVAATIIAAF